VRPPDSRRLALRPLGLRRGSAALFILSGASFMLTKYLQFVLGNSALRAGLLIAPASFVMFFTTATPGFLIRRAGSRALVASGLALVAFGLLATSRLGPGHSGRSRDRGGGGIGGPRRPATPPKAFAANRDEDKTNFETSGEEADDPVASSPTASAAADSDT